MKAIGILGLAAAVAAVLFLPSTLPASAQPIDGAYYAGDITCDDPPCGSVSFRVSQSPDGLKVRQFTAHDVPGHVPDKPAETCEFWRWTYPYDDLDIEEDDSFGPGIPDSFEVSGSFLSEGNAEGTLRLVTFWCDTGVLDLDWTATITSVVGGIAVLPDVSDSSVPNYIPLAGLTAAALVALTAGGWQARRRRLR